MRYFPLALGLFAAACTSPAQNRHGGGSAGSGDLGGLGGADAGGGGGGGGGDGGSSANGCSEAAKLVYVIDNDGTFSSFKPDQTDITKSVFTDLGKLSCMTGGNALNKYQPFSMSVDRNGTAWVEYVDQNGLGKNELFKVSTTDASCTATTFTGGQSGFELFGMGFVSNAAMSNDETLFLAGATTVMAGGKSQLGSIDLNTFAITPVGMMKGNPELTGTGLGDLWGFFPDATDPHIAKLDKTNAAESGPIALPAAAGKASAWAFAFYGGDFWVFLANGGATTVYHVTPAGPKDQLDTKTRKIVGAGVSTCAPTVPIG